MKLTNYTDYSLRVLIFLAAERPGELSNIKQIAETYSISKNHLMKVIYRLGQARLRRNDTRTGRRHTIRHGP